MQIQSRRLYIDKSELRQPGEDIITMAVGEVAGDARYEN